MDPCEKGSHAWIDVDHGRLCTDCEEFEECCSTCGAVPCMCDLIYDSWKDRQLELEME